MIRASVGISTERNSARGALEAARQVVEGLGGEQPDWCIAFATMDHGENLHALLESLSGAAGTPYVAGCSASGILGAGAELEQGPAIGLLGVRSDQMRATPFLFHDEGDRGMTVGIRLGQRLLSSRNSDDMLLVWPDPYHVRPDRLLQSIDAVLGSVRVVGGAASARGIDGSTFQFCGSETGSTSVSGIRLGGRFRHAIGITQGCRPLGGPVRVTRSHDNMILEIDGRPALEVLRQQAPTELMEDLEWAFNFLFVGLMTGPAEVEATTNEYVARNILSADPDTGVLTVAERVEEGQSILFAHREAGSAKEDLKRLLEEVSPRHTGLDYKFGLYFNCLARGRSLYDEDGTDTAMIGETLPDVPIIGFFSNAEIGPLRGVNQLFTYTGILLLVAE
jgi:small ligand-binding sensory domain FIST